MRKGPAAPEEQMVAIISPVRLMKVILAALPRFSGRVLPGRQFCVG